MMISDETIEALNKLVQQGFILNRLWDRGLSVLGVKFSMNNFNKIYHVGLAHRFPIDWSDYFSNVMEQYNVTTKYYVTPEDSSDYNSPREFFDKNLIYHQNMYQVLKSAIDTAILKGDVNVEKYLNQFVPVFNKYMEQAILLRDKAYCVKDEDWFMFDYMCGSFFLFGEN